MSSDVWFARMRARDPGSNTISKIRTLFDRAELGNLIMNGSLTAIKIHFGERGNDGYISPVYARQVVEKIREHGGKPFLTDSNTLYLGSRSNAVDHLVTAIEHGFDYSVAGAPLIIADGLSGKNYREVPIPGNHFKKVMVSGDIADAGTMIVLSHFKGHEVAGFGGAIKNLAMGCAPPKGKQAQHSSRPFIQDNLCTGCGTCVNVCPASAVSLNGQKSRIDRERCIGCFECMTQCPERAIDIDWETDIADFIEKMVEHALGAVTGKKAGYMNFLTRITPDCDCVPWSDAPVVPDIGILASRDAVAIDAASFDLVNNQAGFTDSRLLENFSKGGDKFRGMRKNTDGYRQIRYAEKIGLGSASYHLVEIS